MLIIIYLVSALITGSLYSFFTTLLLVYGVEQTGVDPGSPGLLLFGLMGLCIIESVITAIVMSMSRKKYRKEFPAKLSLVLFILAYLPFCICNLYFPNAEVGFFTYPISFLFLFSYIPFFHMVAQGLINLPEFFKKRRNGRKKLHPELERILSRHVAWLVSQLEVFVQEKDLKGKLLSGCWSNELVFLIGYISYRPHNLPEEEPLELSLNIFTNEKSGKARLKIDICWSDGEIIRSLFDYDNLDLVNLCSRVESILKNCRGKLLTEMQNQISIERSPHFRQDKIK